jgi:hypothetical protein
MTHQDLRDLLHDQVADLETPDLAAGAWRHAVRRRRRRRLVTAGGAMLAVVVLVGAIAAVTDREGRDLRPAPPVPTPSVTTPPADATYQDLPVWWSPDLDEELDLPGVDQAPLFRHLRLGAADTDLADELIPRAVAAFGRGDEVVLVAPDRTLRRVRVDFPAPADDADGNPTARYGPAMLSSDGRTLEVRQGDDRAVLDVATATWSTAVGEREPTPVGPVVLQLPPAMQNPVGTAHVSGAGATGQSWGMGPAIPVRDASRYLSGPAYLVVTGRPEGTSVLAFMTGIDDVRWMDAPSVAGWLDEDTVVYESITEDRDLLVSWKVGTHTFRRLGTIPPGWVSSFAELP